MTTDAKQRRKRLYVLLQVGRRRLGMEEGEYRSFLAAHGAGRRQGRISATTLGLSGLQTCVDDMVTAGFRPIPRSRGMGDWRSARIDKIKALWRLLFKSGVIRDGRESAMRHWCAKVTRKAGLELSTSRELNVCIEGLKAWARRNRIPVNR